MTEKMCVAKASAMAGERCRHFFCPLGLADADAACDGGVTIFGVQNGRVVWGRLYMEPVDVGGAGIDAQMQSWDHGTRS